MPATTVARFRNPGRRACALILFVVVPLASQSFTAPGRVSRIVVQSPLIHLPNPACADCLATTGHRLIWRSEVDVIQKISVTVPRAPGLWLRVTNEEDGPITWRFVAFETGRSRILLFDRLKTPRSFRLDYESFGAQARIGPLPVVFTLTEG